MTSQSRVTVRSPSAAISMIERRLLPINLWISCVRPDGPPRPISRCVRTSVARGSMEYSAVTQPTPLPFKNGGTRSSIEAVQITRVSPISIKTEPSAYLVKPVVILTCRISRWARPSFRLFCFESVMTPDLHRIKMWERFSKDTFGDAVKALGRIGNVEAVRALFLALIRQPFSFEQACSLFRCRLSRINEADFFPYSSRNSFFEQGIMCASKHQRVNSLFPQRRQIFLSDHVCDRRVRLTLFNQRHEEGTGTRKDFKFLMTTRFPNRIFVCPALNGGFGSDYTNPSIAG